MKTILPHASITCARRGRRIAVPWILVATAGIFFAVPSLAETSAAPGGQLIPSVGMTRSVDGDQARASVGIAARAPLMPGLLDAELGVSYRSQQYYGGTMTVRSWPLTASAWLTPMRPLYAGGGVGWYNTSYRYSAGSPGEDRTTQKLGLHLGGGMQLPLGRSVALDASGRYIFLGKEDSGLFPDKYNPDSWVTSVGLAIRF
ncbi:MAG: outer membrane beta-barrel protein [Candidatus Eisenbacteria bacterium]|nr:outer membrane beta-barrel protein [Candidatus Eisenbacteria bacterium]